MAYCIKCGKQNPDTAKFCTGCGNTLIPNTTLEPSKTDDEYKKIVAPSKKSKYQTWIIIAIIAVIGLSAGAYFLFFNKKKDVTNIKTTETKDTNVITSPTSKQNITPTKVSNTVPLKPGSTGADISITDYEVNTVAEQIQSFYNCEQNEDISCLMRHYQFPLDKYYQLHNVSYNQLYQLIAQAFKGSLYYHRITIKWDWCTVQNINGGYKARVYAEYESASKNAIDKKIRNIQVIIIMNTDYEITSIYEV